MKVYETLISAEKLVEKLNHPDWAIVDCRFSLADPALGSKLYRKAHIPGAVYAHLDDDLSGRVIPGKTGRHPLPEIDEICQTFSRWGISAGNQVVAYDDAGGAIAARLWWMLRWLGHTAAAVLDGGWGKWQRNEYAVKQGVESRQARPFTPTPREAVVVDTQGVLAMRIPVDGMLIDSRRPERYRGELETIDAVAGHIPGAINAPYSENLDANGLFLSQERLKARFELLLGAQRAEQAVFYCGSGVTAAHNILAMAHAGLGEARMYPGSWSEWITDANREISREAVQ
ncbi:MAG: sulfurtransferase [Anaerolineae bacterium]|nr:sulfurtransferase [Anaerolineae bacterium]